MFVRLSIYLSIHLFASKQTPQIQCSKQASRPMQIIYLCKQQFFPTKPTTQSQCISLLKFNTSTHSYIKSEWNYMRGFSMCKYISIYLRICLRKGNSRKMGSHTSFQPLFYNRILIHAFSCTCTFLCPWKDSSGLFFIHVFKI